MLDLGANPAPIQVTDFLCEYWNALSYGNLSFGLKACTNADGIPIIPTLRPADDDPMKWGDLIRKYLSQFAEEVWIAAGRKMRRTKRLIPSIVLVQNYDVSASAGFRGFDHSSINLRLPTPFLQLYEIGDVTHIKYDLAKYSARDLPEVPAQGRRFWATLCHEYAHNFLEFADLYGPQGTTGYWDLLGDNSPPGRMSEVSSVFKERLGWRSFKRVINGPRFPRTNLSLRPYTTSGDAIKIIPDPDNNPHEFFVLEYRKSTGRELWRPDGGLQEEGLLITHFNTRLGVAPVWLMREAPYFDPEFADYSDRGAALWTGHDQLNGILYPNNGNNSFTPTSLPNSNFYGGRRSGLSIENIRVSGGRCRFSVTIRVRSFTGWNVSSRDRAVAGQFHGTSRPHTIFMRDDDSACMLRMLENQWFVVQSAGAWIGNWELKSGDRDPLIGDFNGDDSDEMYFRDSNRAGIIEWAGSWRSITVQSVRIGSWRLGANDWETVANVDGDDKDEIVIRSNNWIGLLKLNGRRRREALRLLSIQEGTVESWDLRANDGLFAGNFRDSTKQDVLLTAEDDIGLLDWNVRQARFRLVRKQSGRVDGWNIRRGDKFLVGDFDADGLDEIYVRSARWAGLLKWNRGRFRLLWIRQNNIEHINGDDANRQNLASTNRSYRGRFLPDRDCILHRANDRIAILAWDGSEIQVRQFIKSSFGDRWRLGNGDRFVFGDFHSDGVDRADPNRDYVGDGITDIFMHNGWGTGMVGVNYAQWDLSDSSKIREEMGLTWIQERKILSWITGG